MFKRELVFRYNGEKLFVCGVGFNVCAGDAVDTKFNISATVNEKPMYEHSITVELKIITKNAVSCLFSVRNGGIQHSLVELPKGASHTIDIDVKANKIL